MKAVPTTWDDTRYIDGYPGRYAVIARRHGSDWYIVGVNASSSPVTLNMSPDMIAPGERVRLYSDDKNLVGSVSEVKADKKGRIKVTMPTGGGFVIMKRSNPDFHVYLCLGQSNMEGNARYESCDTAGISPRFHMMAAVDMPGKGRLKGRWYTAQPPLARGNTGLTPADYFGRELVKSLPEKVEVGVINVAVGGCRIELFDPINCADHIKGQPDWLKSTVRNYDNNPYQRLIDMARAAQADGVIKGILLHQGESNTGDAEWPVKVKNLYERILADLLPIDWDKTSISVITNGNNQRRINKVMALAYLGKNYLWAASPLMNYSSTGSREYNREYAQKAADAFGELLNLVEKGATQYELVSYDKIGEVFYSYGQNGRMPGLTEVIFRGPEWDPWQNTRYGLALQYVPTPYHPDGGGNNLSPCANYVNYYGMANGLPIDDPESLWDKTHPWKDRDPRFYNDIVFDGCLITDNYQNPLPNIELFTSGASRDINTASRTGYSLKKFLHPTCNRYDDGWGWSPQFTIGISYLRLADVYLMYAEAAAQASGSPSGKSAACQLSALDAINKIRQRAGVENVNSKFTGNIDSFMSELRRERAVELSFEGHRFNDLRRWMLIDKPEYANKTSVEFKRTGDFDPAHPENNAVSGYHEEVIVSRSYSEKHYWLPLKKSDCNISAEFKQNLGW